MASRMVYCFSLDTGLPSTTAARSFLAIFWTRGFSDLGVSTKGVPWAMLTW